MTEPARHGWAPAQLMYCSNVHPGASLPALQEVVARQVAGVRELRGLAAMGAGLWLSAEAAWALCADADELAAFGQLLARSGLVLRTLNGFPHGDFHAGRVKAQVYRPDWADPARLAYTLDLARILAACLPPEEGEGSISTLPLGFAPDWNPDRHARALAALCELVQSLAALREETGRCIRVCLEMEPGCVLETTGQAVAFFTADLPAAGAGRGISPALLARHLGVCYDVCHQAVMFEDAAQSLGRLAAAGVNVGKIQISSALELRQPGGDRPQRLLGGFAEPRYFHQVRTADAAGGLSGVMDLPDAFAADALSRVAPWRIHFHVPLQAASLAAGELGTTRQAVLDVLAYLSDHPGFRPHLEVETYTWQVLPPDLRPATDPALRRGLAGELHWLEQAMRGQGLLREDAA